MKKSIAFCLIFMGIIFQINGQIYTPSGTIQGVSSNDNIGIGTNQPIAKLTVKAGPDGYPTPLKAISIWGPNSPGNSNSAQDLSWDFASAGSASIRSYRGGSWDTYLQFLTNSNIGGNAPQVRMHIDYAGNVGIGTITPSVKLDVMGTIKSYETTSLGNSLNSFQLINERGGTVGFNNIMNRLWFLRDAMSNDWFTARLHDGISIDSSYGVPHIDTKTWWERDPRDNIQSWGNASETYLTINAGNVGIGTANPTSKLTVAGDINSREVKVTVNAGADFVFEKDYNLPSLDSVNKYLKENKHLPEIASAKEMQANGINLSEMNIKLLQKIEELTLYVIEQEKKNIKQSIEIETLKKENELYRKLSERLSQIENKLRNN
jgi:hypothetical protein